MPSTPDLTRLALERRGGHLRFLLRPQEDILAELPAGCEQLFQARLAEILRQPGPLTAGIDLQNLPGINSRQLGSIIVLGKVLRGRFGPLPITGVSPAVQNLCMSQAWTNCFGCRKPAAISPLGAEAVPAHPASS